MTTKAKPAEILAGLRRDARHNYYYGDHGPFPSVTRIVGTLDKSAPLVGWAKRETAACAVRNLDMITQMIERGGKDSAIKWLSAIPDYQRDEAADLGTRVHSLAEAISRGEDVNPTGLEVPYIRAWRSFVAKTKPKILLAETMVCSLEHAYAGTLDLVAEIDGVVTLLDIKTGKAVYDETALQLAGYALAEFWATPDDPRKHRLPVIERFGVVHLQPDDWSLIPFVVDADTKAAFLALRAVHEYARTMTGHVQGIPIHQE